MSESKWVAVCFRDGETIVITQKGAKYITWKNLHQDPASFGDVTRYASARRLARVVVLKTREALLSEKVTGEDVVEMEVLLFLLPNELDLWPKKGIHAILLRGSQTYYRLSYDATRQMFWLTRVVLTVAATSELMPL